MRKLILLLLIGFMSISANVDYELKYLVFTSYVEAKAKHDYIYKVCKLNEVFDSKTERLCYIQKSYDNKYYNIVYDIKCTKGFGYDFQDELKAISQDSLFKLNKKWENIY